MSSDQECSVELCLFPPFLKGRFLGKGQNEWTLIATSDRSVDKQGYLQLLVSLTFGKSRKIFAGFCNGFCSLLPRAFLEILLGLIRPGIQKSWEGNRNFPKLSGGLTILANVQFLNQHRNFHMGSC